MIGFFDAQVLELQKEYARKLLTHRNTYTGQTYAEDPAVAFVEINNENGLIHAWLAEEVDKLPQVFRSELRQRGTNGCASGIGTTEKLRQAWAAGAQPLGEEAARQRRLLARQLSVGPWNVMRAREASIQAVDAVPEALPGGKSVQITVTKPGTQSWHIRFEQAGVQRAGGPSGHAGVLGQSREARCDECQHRANPRAVARARRQNHRLP